jgi:hypothetical protein
MLSEISAKTVLKCLLNMYRGSRIDSILKCVNSKYLIPWQGVEPKIFCSRGGDDDHAAVQGKPQKKVPT